METGKLLTDRVADEIVKNIIGKDLKAGDKLPNEFELASMLGVGRSTVREAIKTLVSRRVVEIRRGAGTFVSACSGVSEDPLGLQFLEDPIRVATDLLELRFVVEPRLATLAAARCTPEQLEELMQLCDACEKNMLAGNDFSQENTAFHAAIARASGNVVVPNLAVILCGSPSMLTATPSKQIREELARTHREIVTAIAARDGMAAYDAMLLHLAQCRRSIAEQALQ
ncbi:MAG: FadR/GntR family transcriptional regulator [Eubacteriales bacterium]|nr:FadR/GntR family transcriptional regulator [Eubacteriales bacterium]